MRFYKVILCNGLALLVGTTALAIPEGSVAPDFTLTDLITDEDFSLSDYAGSVIVLNFWAYW